MLAAEATKAFRSTGPPLPRKIVRGEEIPDELSPRQRDYPRTAGTCRVFEEFRFQHEDAEAGTASCRTATSLSWRCLRERFPPTTGVRPARDRRGALRPVPGHAELAVSGHRPLAIARTDAAGARGPRP